MSWFIMMALVDVSTVLTYSLWGIPLSVVKEDPKANDKASEEKLQRILGINLAINYWNAWSQQEWADETFIVYRNYNNHRFAPCELIDLWSGSNIQKYLLWRKFSEYKKKWAAGDEIIDMLGGYCMHNGVLFSFPGLDSSKGKYDAEMKSFKYDLQNYANPSALENAINAGLIFPFSGYNEGSSGTMEGGKSVKIGENTYQSYPSDCLHFWFLTWGSTKCIFNEAPDFTIDTLLEKASSYTGPFISLYSSLINYSYLTSNGSTMTKMIEMFLNALFAVVLLLPLLWVAIVLFARVAILWIVIATSPALVLIEVFKDLLGKGLSWSSFWKHFEVKNIVKLLFAPVLITFALGVSIVFMTALKNTLWTPDELKPREVIDNDRLYDVTGLKMEEDGSVSLLWFIKIQRDAASVSLSWIITMLFGIAITWFLLFWAIKQNSIWETIWNTLQSFWEKTLWTIPILPTPHGGVGFWALSSDKLNQYTSKLSSKIRARDEATLNKLFPDESFWKDDSTKPSFDIWSLSEPDFRDFDVAFRNNSKSIDIGGKTIQIADAFSVENPHLTKNFAKMQNRIGGISDTDQAKKQYQDRLNSYYKDYVDPGKAKDFNDLKTRINQTELKGYMDANYDTMFKNKEFALASNDGKKYKIIKKTNMGNNEILYEVEEVSAP